MRNKNVSIVIVIIQMGDGEDKEMVREERRCQAPGGKGGRIEGACEHMREKRERETKS